MLGARRYAHERVHLCTCAHVCRYQYATVCFFELISAEGPKPCMSGRALAHLSAAIHVLVSSGQILCIQFPQDPFGVPRSWGRHSISLQFLAQCRVSYTLF